MQNQIGAAGHAFDTHVAARRVKKGQQLGGAIAHILVRLADGLSTGLPTGSWIRASLIGSGLILRPNGQSQPFAQLIGAFDQLFLAVVSASLTVTWPPLRLRSACPVSHQLRDCCQLKPASRKTVRMVSSLTSGKPSGDRRNV
jgi:hypothetical protein